MLLKKKRQNLMSIATELHTNDIPNIYHRFSTLIGEKRWKAQVVKLKKQLRFRKHLQLTYDEDFQIVYELAKCANSKDANGMLAHNKTTDRSIYAALSFAAQTLSIIDNLPKTQRPLLVARIRSAISNAEDMRALRLELLVATHFSRAGSTVEWPEITQGDSTVDLLLPNLGKLGCEIECKSISRDKGKKIHREEAQDFLALVKTTTGTRLRGLSVNLAVVVTLPDRLTKNRNVQTILAHQVVGAVLTNTAITLDDGTTIKVSEVEQSKFDSITSASNRSQLSFAIDQATNTRNEESTFMTNGKGSLVCVIRSAKQDTLGDSLRTTLRQSARTQASGNRPLFFVVSLQDLEPDELRHLSTEDMKEETCPTVLKVIANQLIQSTTCPYIVGISFLSGKAIGPSVYGEESSDGRSYSFLRPESPFYDKDIEAFFELTKS